MSNGSIKKAARIAIADRSAAPARYGTVIARNAVFATCTVRPSTANATDGSQDVVAKVIGGHLPVAGARVRLDYFKGEVLVFGAVNVQNYANEPVRAAVYQSAATEVATGTSTAVEFDVEDYDAWGMHSNVTNPSRITTAYNGLFEVKGNIVFDNNVTGYRQNLIRLNGTDTIAYSRVVAVTGGLSTPVLVCKEVKLTAGDYLELIALQNSGASLNTITGATQSWFSIRKVADS